MACLTVARSSRPLASVLAVTVTVCAVDQVVDVNLSDDGDTVTSGLSDTDGRTVTVPVGCAVSATV